MQRFWLGSSWAGRKTDRRALFRGQDRARGVGDLGIVKFSAETLHDLRSRSKSIVALLYGIALQQGMVPMPGAALLSGFPEYRKLADKERSRVTVHHALSMTIGMDWDESSLPYADPRNSETAMGRPLSLHTAATGCR
jgi:CubicO group peptidase (beta-lactamase class C family)